MIIYITNYINNPAKRVFIVCAPTSAAIFIEKLEFFCDFEIQECNILDSKPLIYDSGHLTDHGAIFFGNKLRL